MGTPRGTQPEYLLASGGRHAGGTAARESSRDGDRDDRDQDHERHDDVHLREQDAVADLAEDPDGQSALGAGSEGGHDDLVERQREGQHGASHDGSRDEGQRNVAKHLEAVGAEVHGGLDQRSLRAAKSGEHVVVDDHDAEGGVAYDYGRERQRDVVEAEERVQRDACDDARQGQGQDEEQAHHLAAEEPGAVDRERGARAEDEGDRRRQEPGLERHEQGRPHVVVVPSGAEPLERQPGNGPALDVRGVERIQEDQEDRDVQEQHDKDSPEAQEDASADAFHRLPSILYSASKAPSL